MRGVLHVVLFSAAWIALCAVALAVESCLILQVPVEERLLAFIAAATCCHYNLHYLVRTPDPARSTRDQWLAVWRRWVSMVTLVAGVLAVVLLLRFTTDELLIVSGAVLVSAAYSLPVLPRGGRLRDLGVLKPFLLALVWALVTVWLPAREADPYLLGLVLVRRFVFMATLCLAFDIRDVEKDRAQGIRTVPVRRGSAFTYRLIDGLLFVFVVLALLVEVELRRPAVAVALTVSAGFTALAVRLTRTWSSEVYYLAIIDGMMVLQAALVALATFHPS